MDYIDRMQTIVELPEFIRKSSSILTDTEKNTLIEYLACHQKSGDIIEGAGGIRKLRWGYGNRGKSAGSRVVYYFYNETIPLFLLTIYGKNEKSNLSKSECNELEKLTKILIKNYR